MDTVRRLVKEIALQHDQSGLLAGCDDAGLCFQPKLAGAVDRIASEQVGERHPLIGGGEAARLPSHPVRGGCV